MRISLATILLLIFIACNNSTDQLSDVRSDDFNKKEKTDYKIDPQDPVAQYLVTSCITDFYRYGQIMPVEFRNCYIGYSPIPQDYGTISCLSGEFQSKTNQEWMPFITIKTIEYEQWIGSQAEVFRKDSTIIWDQQTDFSPYLKAKMDSLQSK